MAIHRDLTQTLKMRTGRVRQHDEKYLRFVRELPCVICGSPMVEAHHEPPKGMGSGRSSDYDAVPLCPVHHRIRHGQEKACNWVTADWVRVEAEKARRPILQAYFAGAERVA